MEKSEIIKRLEKIASHAIHFIGEPSFVMSLDDGIALDDAVLLLKERVEVIRCKDCTFRNEINCPLYYRRSEFPDNWYCADGERREDDA